MERDAIKTQINYIVNTKDVGSITIEYKDFCKNIDMITNLLGFTGIIMFSEQTAAISFNEYNNVRFIVSHNRMYKREDFMCFDGIRFKIVGKEQNKKEKFIRRFLDDVLTNIVKIIIISIIYLFFYAVKVNFESLEKLNNLLINVVNIFIASFFVFIGFFYSDKSKNINMYKKGIFDKYMRTDLYVLKVSFIALLFCLISCVILNSTGIGVFVSRLIQLPFELQKFSFIKYYIPIGLTLISILCIIICFDSISNYYIKKIRTTYFIDAYDEMLKDENEKKLPSKIK